MVIGNVNHTVTVTDSRTAASVTLAAGNRAPELVISAGVTLTVTGSVEIGQFGGSPGTRRILVGAGSGLDVGGDLVFIGGTGDNRNSTLELADGTATTVNIAGDFGGSATGADFNGVNRNQITFNGRGTLRIGGNFGGNATLSPGTGSIELNGAGAQSIGSYATTSSYFYNLTINKAGGTATFAGNQRVRGNVSDNGRLDALTGSFLVTLDGTTQQSLLGSASATTFYQVTVDNSSGLLLSHDMNISNLLTLTNGYVNAGTKKVFIQNGSAISGAGGSNFVAGNLSKNFSVGDTTRAFEVGSLSGGARYAPVSVRLGDVTTAGEFGVSTTSGDHPNIATSSISLTKSVNRYWSLSAPSVAFNASANNEIVFTFLSTDIDAGAATASFQVDRYNGSTWSAITPSGRSATTTTISGSTITQTVIAGAYQIGEAKAVAVAPDSFNAFEANTGAAAITGQIYTKLAGIGFALDIVAIQSSAKFTSFSGTVSVDLVTGSTGGANCPGSPVAVSGASNSVTLSSGRGATPSMTVANAYKDVRVRIRYPTSSPTVTTCSTDNFSIRPTGFSVSSSNATQTGSSGSPTIKTGANFNLSAVAVAGYDGTPAINNSLVTGTPNAGTIGGSFGAANTATGIAVGNSFYYSEVGNFGLSANAVYDSTFTSVDQTGDCISGSTSNTLAGEKYGCNVGSAAVAQTTGSSGFGRFIPDNFDVAVNTPSFSTGCSGFTYIGQAFNYSVAPVMTVTARAGTNNGLANGTTKNYAGAYAKLTNTSLAQVPYEDQGKRYSRFDALSGSTPGLDVSNLPAVTSDPSIGTFSNGVGTLTFSSGSGLSFLRSGSTPTSQFDADISLRLNVVDADGVVFSSNPAAFSAATAGNGIIFSDGDASTTIDKKVRFGRIAISSAAGSQLLPLLLRIQAQYWNGVAFIDNPMDACTMIQATNVGLGNFTQNLSAGETTATITNTTLVAGRSAVRLSAPGVSNNGGVDVSINLGGGSNANGCPAFTPTTAASAGRSYLRGRWCGSAHDRDPVARARFGIRGGNPARIDMREKF